MKLLTLVLAVITISSIECVVDYSLEDLINIFLRGAGLTADMLFYGESKVPIEQDVTFWCINRKNPNFTQATVNDTTTNIDSTKPFGFLIHGWIDNGNRTWIREAATEWVKYQDINVCIVDWNRLANYEYTIAANLNTRKVGAYIAVFINYLQTLGIKLNDITLTGHSLGGQIAGFTGAAFKGQIGSIIGLDPANPLFTFPVLKSIDNRLDPTDAKFVQVIHTTSGLLGVYNDCGHNDFYPNAGIAPQIGCILPLFTDSPTPECISCSHFKANSYFIKSLNPAVSCKASQCDNYFAWFTRMCLFTPTERFGIYNSKKYIGRFYHSTTEAAPYCTGLV